MNTIEKHERIREIREAYERAYRELSGRAPPRVIIEFYPYAGIKATLRYGSPSRSTIIARISDVLEEAPLAVHNALAYILVARLLGKKPPLHHERVYRLWTNSETAKRLHARARRERGRRERHEPQGKHKNLEESFERVNKKYFHGAIEMPVLKWSPRRTRRKLGHYDPTKNVIMISKSLDDQRVPDFVLDYVMYHEMLHMVEKGSKGRYKRRVHTREFRDKEKEFEEHEEAEDWLRRL